MKMTTIIAALLTVLVSSAAFAGEHREHSCPAPVVIYNTPVQPLVETKVKTILRSTFCRSGVNGLTCTQESVEFDSFETCTIAANDQAAFLGNVKFNHVGCYKK